MKKPAHTNIVEQRWPVIIAIVLALVLLSILPERIRLFPVWSAYLVVIVVLLPMIIIGLIHESVFWQKVERVITFVFCFVIGVTNMINLANLVHLMISKSVGVNGLQLLISGLGVWVNNLLAFSLFFWLIDRGGPNARSRNDGRKPDWFFPQESAPKSDTPSGWRPVFIDYLFLGFCTATAFSPTDVLPLTPRGKLLVMFESSVSLLTILVVMSRAINILGN
jgi:hypothetical protein